MKKNIVKDFIGWDVMNWSQALPFWEKHFPEGKEPLKCLELGGKQGGLALWLAMKGHQVVCSDLTNPEEAAQPIHLKYNLSDRVSYEAIDATDIPYSEQFDIIVFKSILGGISRMEQDVLKKQTISEVYKALKPGGVLFFAENLEASFLHQFFRRTFVKWGKNWNYLKLNEVESVFEDFNNLQIKTGGFLGTFGRNETQRQILSAIDKVVIPIIPRVGRYIIFGVAKK